jgi:hypothetical protein
VNTLKINYSEHYCLSLCIQQYIIDSCGCANAVFPKFLSSTIHYCISVSEIKCSDKIINSFGDSKAEDLCNLACPSECFSIEFDMNTFHSLYPNEYYLNVLFNYT